MGTKIGLIESDGDRRVGREVQLWVALSPVPVEVRFLC